MGNKLWNTGKIFFACPLLKHKKKYKKDHCKDFSVAHKRNKDLVQTTIKISISTTKYSTIYKHETTQDVLF